MDQELALNLLKSGHNVVLTGSAGTGKTFVLNQFIVHLRKHRVKHAVTASTGLAATHLNGVTIHSWAKIGIRDFIPSGFTNKLAEKDKERILNNDVLIIDEISMLHDYRLDLVDEVCRKVRKNSEPFGGMQIVLCGDFFQLPPVNSRSDARHGGFAISSNVWELADFKVCYLTTSFRQSGDVFFNEILDAIRYDDVRRRHAEALLGRLNAKLPDNFEPTQLYVTNVDSDRINQLELNRINEPLKSYEVARSGRAAFVETLLKSCLANEVVELKLRAQVMFIRNNPVKGYINGTLGKIIDFTNDEESLPIVRTLQGKTIVVERETWELKDDPDEIPKARITQIPLKLAWAITVHKSQGMTLDAATIDLSKAFVEGMGYVALSRVRSLENLKLLGINKIALRVAPEALEIDRTLRKQSSDLLNKKDELLKQVPHYTLHEPVVYSESTPKVTTKKGEKTGPNGGTPLLDLRKAYPNAYSPWDIDEDLKLIRGYNEGLTTKQLSVVHRRQPGAIRSRIKKLLEK